MISGESGFMVALSHGTSGKQARMTFKNMKEPSRHYHLAIFEKEGSAIIDLHYKDESETNPALAYKTVMIMTITPKVLSKEALEEIEEDFRKRIPQFIIPLTEEELSTEAFFFEEGLFSAKKVVISQEDLKALPFNQAPPLSYAGIAEENGHKVGIFIKNGRYYKLNMFEFATKSADLLDRLTSITMQKELGGLPEQVTWSGLISKTLEGTTAVA
jgi:hypothetical protein